MTSAASPPTSPDSIKSPGTLASEALAEASRKLQLDRAGKDGVNGGEERGKENNDDAPGAELFPNGRDEGGKVGETISGTKRGRDGGDRYGANGYGQSGGGGGISLAVASGSADDESNNNNAVIAAGGSKRNGGSEIWNHTGGGGAGSSGNILMSLASPNTLEGGRGVGVNGGGSTEDDDGGAGGKFAATIKRRRRGGEKTTTTTTSVGGRNDQPAGNIVGRALVLAANDDAKDADDASHNGFVHGGANKNTSDRKQSNNDAEDRLEQIWNDLHTQFETGIAPSAHTMHTGDDEENDEEDATTTLLGSPSTVNTFDTDHTAGTTDGHANPHTLLANLTSAALSKTGSLLLTEMEALIASGVQAYHDRDSALRELELMRELADGRGKEVQRLQESERQSRETVSNLLRSVESAKSDARSASRRIQAETRLRSECTCLRTERDAALADAAESKRRAALAEEEARTARSQLHRCQRDKAEMERDSRAALSLARTLDSHTSSDSAYYKRQMAALNEQVQKLNATVTEQNHTINELRRQRERSMSQNQLSQLRAGGGGAGGGGGKKSRHRK